MNFGNKSEFVSVEVIKQIMLFPFKFVFLPDLSMETDECCRPKSLSEEATFIGNLITTMDILFRIYTLVNRTRPQLGQYNKYNILVSFIWVRIVR